MACTDSQDNVLAQLHYKIQLQDIEKKRRKKNEKKYKKREKKI